MAVIVEHEQETCPATSVRAAVELRPNRNLQETVSLMAEEVVGFADGQRRKTRRAHRRPGTVLWLDFAKRRAGSDVTSYP
jgi:hypothetical protein